MCGRLSNGCNIPPCNASRSPPGRSGASYNRKPSGDDFSPKILRPSSRELRETPGSDGRLWVEPLRLWLGIEDEAAVCYDENGEKLKDHAELMQDLKAEAEARKAAEARSIEEIEARRTVEGRLKQLEAEVQRLRGQSNGGPPNPSAS